LTDGHKASRGLSATAEILVHQTEQKIRPRPTSTSL